VKRTSKSRVSVIAVIAAVLGGCAQDFDEDYGVYYSGDSATPRHTAKIKPKIPQIPLPDRALLETPAEPDCGAAQGPRRPGRPESATATAGLATPTAAEEGAAGDANADLALRIKLEYERECYRQAEARMRDRLKQLQASTTQTVKAVKGTEQGAR
jgi:hypothetical protein